MSNPLVSIIIPTYNRAHIIGETLDSVLAQTYTNWECIIVDDGSTDNTVEVVNSYIDKDARFQFHYRPMDKPKGGNAARNYGFELSKGDFIQWFDDDDIMLPCFLENKIKLFSPELQLVIVTGYYVDYELRNQEHIFLNEKALLFKEYVTWNLKILTPSILFRKSFLLGKELFLEMLVRGQETELFSRLFFKLSPALYVISNVPLFLYRQHSKTKSFRNLNYIKSYKSSESFVDLKKLAQCLVLGDLDLTVKFYKKMINYFFRSLENDHFTNSYIILKKVTHLLMPMNKRLCFELIVLGGMLIIMKRGSYSLEKRWRTWELKV